MKKLLKILICTNLILILVFSINIFYNNNNNNNNNNNKISNNAYLDNITDYNKINYIKDLKEKNKDIIGWLEIENTNINSAVVQTNNNEYYMTHNYLKKFDSNGALFLDKDYNWNIPSTNLLIYGHNNENNKMFSELLKFEKKDFYLQHQTFNFTTTKEDSKYEIIAVFYSRVYYKDEDNVFRYYYFLNAQNENEFNKYIENCKKSSIFDTGKTAIYGDQLMTLSTCSYHTEDGRFVIVAKKIKHEL